MRQIVRNLTFEAPVGIGWDGQPVPRYFDSWSWLPEAKGLRLHLRPGIRFHDGTLLTSALAVDILREGLAPGSTISSIKSIEVEDDSHVVISTSRSEGFLLADLAEIDFGLPGNPEIQTGPFRKVSDGPPVVLEPFDRYHQGRPTVDRVEIRSYTTQRAAWTAMMRGETNMLYQVSSDAADFQEAETAIQTHTFVRPFPIALFFNLRHPVFKHREVRKALNEAIDKQRIVDVGMRKRGLVLDTPVWPFHWAYSAAQRKFTFNPDAARLRLDAAGFTEGRERASDRMPSRFRFTCQIVADDQSLERIALLLQKQLFDIGVDMDVQPVPFAQLAPRLGKGDFETVLLPINGSRSLTRVYAVFHSPLSDVPQGPNMGYSGADQALDRLRAAVLDEDVRAAVADIQQAFYEDPPAVFLAWTTATRALTRDFQVPDQGPRDIMGSIWQWQPVGATSNARR